MSVVKQQKSLTIKYVLLRIVIIISFVELFIMLLFAVFDLHMATITVSVVDAFLLSFISTPFIYYWVIKPFIDERDLADSKVKHLSLHDSLTGLPNRRYLELHIDNMIKQAKRKNSEIALFYIDLDGFKAVNDNYGHITGDLVLKKVAQQFNKNIRDNEFFARLGGDEFCLVVSDFINQDNLHIIAKRLLNNCACDLTVENNNITIGLSIGISIYPNNGHTFRELSVQADKAMYRVKQKGKGHYSFAT